jgi:hypothetical protein
MRDCHEGQNRNTRWVEVCCDECARVLREASQKKKS